MIEKVESTLTHQIGSMEDFKVNVYWGKFSPHIATRILRDMFSLARLAKVNKTELVVASAPELKGYIEQLGLKHTSNFDKPDMARVYIESGAVAPEEVYSQIPEDIAYETISLNNDPKPPQSGPYVSEAPYANMPLKRTWHHIPPTMPLDRAPPRGTPEPQFSPFL